MDLDPIHPSLTLLVYILYSACKYFDDTIAFSLSELGVATLRNDLLLVRSLALLPLNAE